MDPTSPRWKEITRSEFPWERDALSYLRERLPDHEPYRAWSNFEFVAEDGSINEVDLLVLTPKGFSLVEIKSRPGVVSGDGGTWTWTHEGRVVTVDNPCLLANRKAKKLISLLKRQESVRRAHTRLPFLQAKFFLSAENVEVRLDSYLLQHVHRRDRPPEDGATDRDGLLYALTKWERGDPPRFRVDRPIAKVLSRAMDEAGIRRSQKARTVGDYRLGELLYYGPGYQDFEARHVSLESVVRRIRIYGVATEQGATSRETVLRAAKREFAILRGITHPGILKAVDYKEHELGPALVFEHDREAVRLDHFLRVQGKDLDAQQRLNLLRQIAEAVQYAHEKRLVHRALSPQSILVLNAAKDPQIQIFNWQTGARGSGSRPGASVSGTVHVDQLIENPAGAYMAPEAFLDRGSTDEEMDVFSVGAIAYHVFSGQPPASSFYELTERIREGHGLQISSVLDGTGGELQELIKVSTYPEVTGRIPSVSEFLKGWRSKCRVSFRRGISGRPRGRLRAGASRPSRMASPSPKNTWVAGADGCQAGWVVVLRRARSGEIAVRAVSRICELLEDDEPPVVVGLDVPIGLLDHAVPGGRECDREARALLGEPRVRSVFSPPARVTLAATSFRQALRLNRISSAYRVGISLQCFGILPKIREVDELMTPSLQRRALEVHPELAFYELNRKRAVAESKKSRAGLRKRIRLLERAWGCRLSPLVEAHRSSQVARDDIVDAMAVCWTAERVLARKEARIPARPPRDSRGLRMEIVR